MKCREILVAAIISSASAALAGAEAIPNAADIYRQAFAALPKLEGDERAMYDAAILTPTTPLTDDLRPIVARFDDALRELHRANAVAACDWKLDETAGFRLRLPHLPNAMELSQAALLRARLGFAADATDDAVADIVAVLKMARDCAASAMLMPLTVDRALEKRATEMLAGNLPRLSAAQLDDLAETLRDLPATPAVAECVRHEAELMSDWIEAFINAEAAKNAEKAQITDGDGGSILDTLYEVGLAGGPAPPHFKEFTMADLRESLRLLRADYAAVADILDLPPADRRSRLAEWNANRPKARPTDGEGRVRRLSWDLVPNVSSFAEQDDRLRARRELLRLAIDVQRLGPDAAKGVTLPGQKPIEYHPTATGFVLVCGSASTVRPASQSADPAAKEGPQPSPRRPPLEVGSPAPALATGEWVQGEPVASFSKDEAYLLEFWATWCGPCLSSIPHVNEIAATWKDKGLVVIGQNVYEGDENAVRPLVDEMGDKMTYRVALDDKSEMKDGAMAETWLKAADCGGVPWTFLVDKNGMIAWIGHPMEIEESVIERVLDGTFDVSKAATEYRAAKVTAHAAKVAAQARSAAAAEPEVPMLCVGGAQ